jgi:hypothetical protein
MVMTLVADPSMAAPQDLQKRASSSIRPPQLVQNAISEMVS